MISTTTEVDVTSINWVPVTRQYAGFTGASFPEMGLKAVLTLTLHPRKAAAKRELVLRLGVALIRELGWEYGDNILICYDKDDVHNMMVMKNPKGSKLQREGGNKSNGKIFRLAIQAPFLTCAAFKSTTQIYKLDKINKRLFFRLTTEEKGTT